MRVPEPYYTHEEDDFRVDILVGTDDPGTLDDADIEVRLLPAGTRYSASVMTVDVIRRIMDHHARSGESLGGRYLLIPDLLILRRGGVKEIVDVIRDLVRADNIDGVLPRLRDDDDL